MFPLPPFHAYCRMVLDNDATQIATRVAMRGPDMELGPGLVIGGGASPAEQTVGQVLAAAKETLQRHFRN